MKKIISLFVLLLAGLSAFAFSNDTTLVGSTLSDIGTPSIAMATVVKNTLAEKELIKHFRHAGNWLSRVPSKNQWVGNNTINLTEIGADPKVLINNTTYPISTSSRTDSTTAISLHRYDTENTKITDDEAYVLPYDKVGSAQRQHRETLEEETEEHALHSLAPAKDTTKTPVLVTTGADDGSGRKQLTYKDLVNFKKKLNALKIAVKGRCLVLCPDHYADLLLDDKTKNIQFHNHKDGTVSAKFLGFEIFEGLYAPKYTAAQVKIPFGSATTGKEATILFSTKTSAKARGSVIRYQSDAKTNPTMRETVLGFRLFFVCIPLRMEGQGAIVSG